MLCLSIQPLLFGLRSRDEIAQIQPRTVQYVVRKADFSDPTLLGSFDIGVSIGVALWFMVDEKTRRDADTPHAVGAEAAEIAEVVIKRLVLPLQAQILQRLLRSRVRQRVGIAADVVPGHEHYTRLRWVVLPAPRHVSLDMAIRWHGWVVHNKDLAGVPLFDWDLQPLWKLLVKGAGADSKPKHVPLRPVGAVSDRPFAVLPTGLQLLSSRSKMVQLVLQVGIPVHVVFHDQRGADAALDNLPHRVHVSSPRAEIAVSQLRSIPPLRTFKLVHAHG